MEWLFVQNLKKPLNIIKVEEYLKIKFPVSFIECVEKNNAGTPEKNIFDTEITKERIFNYLLSFNLEEEKNILTSYKYLKETLPKNVIPIADDSFGNFICFNFAEELKEPEIVFFNFNNKKIEKVSHTFSDFLEKLYD